MDLDLLDLEYEVSKDTVIKKEYSELSEGSLVPKTGNYLGLDISISSTGICLYKDGIKTTANISLDYKEGNSHAEVLLRRQLKNDLLELIDGLDFEVIVIEDVFEGINPDTTRKLYALNTAIDELILDGNISCNQFERVPNTLWKSWLSVVDTNGVYKGFKDKQKIQGYLKILGVEEGEDKGFQDRLDATGMLLGYLLSKDNPNADADKSIKKGIRVKFEDISFAYELDTDLITVQAYYSDEDINICIFMPNLTVKTYKNKDKYKMVKINNNTDLVFDNFFIYFKKGATIYLNNDSFNLRESIIGKKYE